MQAGRRETYVILLALALSVLSNGLLVIVLSRIAVNDRIAPVNAAITGVQQHITYSQDKN